MTRFRYALTRHRTGDAHEIETFETPAYGMRRLRRSLRGARAGDQYVVTDTRASITLFEVRKTEDGFVVRGPESWSELLHLCEQIR